MVTTAAAARDLAETLETRLHLPLSKEKTVVAASNASTAASLAKALGKIGAKAEEAPTRLGLQFALRPHKGKGLQNKRWAAFKVKVGRLKRIARVKKTGRKPGLMHRALAAGPIFGVEVVPLVAEKVRALRCQAAKLLRITCDA